MELRHKGYLVFSVPNDFVSGAKSAGVAITLGMLPGVSDLVVVLPGKVVFLELKTLTGKQSDRQVKFEARVKSLGHSYAVVRSLDEALKVVHTIERG